MHIPDGYLGPQTYVPALAVTSLFWGAAATRLRKSLRLRQVPSVALAAAFSFVVMMFNVPIPGGTTGHAVGAVLVAILLGPWAAVVAVSLALIVQALVFGDGGVTAIGANCLNMAVVMPFVGWGVYRLIAGTATAGSRRHWLGAAAGGYAGLSAAAILTGFEFGIQPLIAHDAVGRALYGPFGLHIAVPAMALEHLLLFGFVEAGVTGLVVAYLQRTSPAMVRAAAPGTLADGLEPRRLVAALAALVGVMVLLSPLGLWLPAKFGAGSAWGEWSSEEIQAEVARETGRPGYVPAGIARAEASGWKAPMPDYSLPGKEEAGLSAQAIYYILSAAVGVAALGLLLLLLQRVLARRGDPDGPPRVDARPGEA